MRRPLEWALFAGCGLLLSLAVAAQELDRSADPAGPPLTLEETGLYSDFAAREINPNHLFFSPQYPLWSDGATKRRWLSLPEGGVIDGSDPDAWVFPIGTRFWKEFSFDGQLVETRFMERQPDGEWLFAAYEWSADGREARLAPGRGRRDAYPLEGGRFYAIPSVSDCGVCHKGRPNEVLGFGALQLSADRDPGALHTGPELSAGIDLDFLVKHGLIVGLPEQVGAAPPRIAARSAVERATLGYLHGNCGHCHNPSGKLTDLDLVLSQSVAFSEQEVLGTTVGQPFHKPPPGLPPEANLRIVPGQPDRSGLWLRIASRNPALQMPPLGTQLADDEAIELLREWISELPEDDQATEKNPRKDNP